MHTCIHTCTRTYIHACSKLNRRPPWCEYLHIYTHTHIHACMHTVSRYTCPPKITSFCPLKLQCHQRKPTLVWSNRKNTLLYMRGMHTYILPKTYALDAAHSRNYHYIHMHTACMHACIRSHACTYTNILYIQVQLRGNLVILRLFF